MDDNTFINQLAEKLSKLGAVRPIGFHYLHPYGTVPADSIICNGATYSRALYKDFFDYIIAQGWVKTEADWQEIAARDNGFCPFYSSGDGSTNFRVPRFAPYQQIAIASGNAGTYPQAGIPNITGRSDLGGIYSSISFSGAIATVSNEGDATGATHFNAGGDQKVKLTFDASNSNHIDGRSDTVQPGSHEWVFCVVAYGIATNVGAVDIQNVMSAVNAVQASITEVEGKISSKLEGSTVHIIETWKSTNDNSRYHKWSDGFIEQWGFLDGPDTAGGTVTFPKRFSNTNYIFEFAPDESKVSGSRVTWYTENKTTSTITAAIIGSGIGAQKYSWYAAGF